MINRFINVKKDQNLTGKQNSVIIDESFFGILILNKANEILFIDEKAKEVLRAGFETIEQCQNIQLLWKPGIVATEEGCPVPYEESPFAKALETKETHSNTLVVRLSDGSNQYLSVQCVPIFCPDDSNPFSVVCYVSIPTVRKPCEQPIKSFLSSFAIQSADLLWLIDEETNLIYANTSFFRYFSLTANNIPDKITKVVPEAVAKALYDDHIKVLQTNGPVRKEQKLRLADGTTSHFLIHIFPVIDESGQKMAGGHAVYVPDKHAIEGQLREANEELLNIIQAAHNAIWEWDMRTGYIFRNEHLLNMIGYPIEETKDLDWWIERIHPEDREQLSTTLKEAAEKKQMSWEQSYRFKCADETYRHIIDSGFVIYENDRPVKMIGSLKDVTELRELENSLVKEKIQKQNEISETMIEVQERERMRLGGELHDNVNQILTSLRLYFAMLSPDKPTDKEIKDKCLTYIDTAMEEIRKLSKDLVVPQLEENTLVENIKLLISDINGCNGLKINFTYTHESDLLTPGKKLALFRITQEQVKNILKYSKAHEATIYLQYKNRHVELIIKDNGIGFNPRKTLRGVGLSSIHERARFYQGNAEIKTAEGKGCMLMVIMPV